MSLTDRINHPDRRTADVPVADERRTGVERRAAFVAPWRRRQIEQAGSRFVAVTDLTERGAA